MTKHEKLDLILTHLSTRISDIAKRPDTIVREAGLDFEKSESYLMFRLLFDDGYVYEHTSGTYYGIKYKGILFLENGGYTLEHKIYNRKRIASKISDLVDIVVKPIGILTALLISTWYIINLLKFFGIIKSCID